MHLTLRIPTALLCSPVSICFGFNEFKRGRAVIMILLSTEHGGTATGRVTLWKEHSGTRCYAFRFQCIFGTTTTAPLEDI
jgi:hypothetical protein